MVYNTLIANSTTLTEIINNVCRELTYDGSDEWESLWEHGIYKASPTIIETAKNVWRENNVEGFKKGESDESTRLSAEDFIKNVIEETKSRPEGQRHSISEYSKFIRVKRLKQNIKANMFGHQQVVFIFTLNLLILNHFRGG